MFSNFFRFLLSIFIFSSFGTENTLGVITQNSSKSKEEESYNESPLKRKISGREEGKEPKRNKLEKIPERKKELEEELIGSLKTNWIFINDDDEEKNETKLKTVFNEFQEENNSNNSIFPKIIELGTKIESNQFKFGKNQLTKLSEFLSRWSKDIPKKLLSCYPDRQGFSGAIVKLLKEKKDGPIIAAVKVFKEPKKGNNEFMKSCIAYYGLNPNHHKFRMAKVIAATNVNENTPFLIVYEGIQGKNVFDVLDKFNGDKEPVLKVVAEYLAKFHFMAYKKAKEENKILNIKQAQQDINIIVTKFNAGFIEKKVLAEHLKKLTTKQKLTRVQEKEFKNIILNYSDEFGKRNIQSLENEDNNLTITTIHRDAHGGNLYYDKGEITLIDYASMADGPGDPARDVGRFIGSLWSWGVIKGKNCEDILGLEAKIIDNYFKARSKCLSKGKEERKTEFETLFKKNVEFYKIYLFRYFFKENILKDSEKKKLMKLWLQSLEISISKPSVTESASFEKEETAILLSSFQPLVKLFSNILSSSSSKKSDAQPLGLSNITRNNSSSLEYEENEIEGKALSARVAALNLFQPLITEVNEKNNKDYLRKTQEKLNNILDLLIDSEIQKEFTSQEKIKIFLKKFKFEKFSLIIKALTDNNMVSEIENSFNNITIFLKNLSHKFENNNLEKFYNSIIKFRNDLHFSILKKYYTGLDCENCGKFGMAIEKVLGEDVKQCWVCGHEK